MKNEINDENIKVLLEEYFKFKKTSFLPNESLIRKITQKEADESGTSFSTQIISVSMAILDFASEKYYNTL